MFLKGLRRPTVRENKRARDMNDKSEKKAVNGSGWKLGDGLLREVPSKMLLLEKHLRRWTCG